MSFVRPELAATARRWREAVAGGGICLLAVWAWFGGLGVVQWLGLPLGMTGAALIWVGVQRGRFRRPGDGPGVVQVTEGQIAYFGPLTGGIVALESVTSLALDGTGQPAHWLLIDDSGGRLAIPVTAPGTEGLFDAFAQLPDLRTEPLLRALENDDRVLSVLWRRGAPGLQIAQR